MLNKLIEQVAEYLMARAIRKGNVMKITGTGGPDDVYLIRYYIVKSKYCNLFIHQFLRSDHDDLHDHPWNFCTYLVRGAYTEKKFNPKTNQVESTRRANYKYKQYCFDGVKHLTKKTNTFVFRKATDQHQVIVDKDLKEVDKDKAALTIFMSGPTKREWGFIKEVESVDLPSGRRMADREWVDWRTYLGLPSNTPGRG